ncbi:hypothetical protein D3C76_1538090 [compost metagenome]
MLLPGGGDLGEIAKVTQHQLIQLITRPEVLLPFGHHLVDEDIEELNVQQGFKILL